MTGVLSGIRVLDLSRVLAGPFVAQTLADLGAEVIKVERPGVGDESRTQGDRSAPREGANSEDRSGFTAVNRGKKSIALNLASAEGQEIARRLACRCDVVLENFKSGDLKRYALDYETIARLNPAIVYCSITGFGQTGPYSRLPGYDLIFQAMSGLMAATGEPGGGPQRVRYPVSDVTAGLYAVIGVLAALYHRAANKGRGQHIDVALLDAQIAAMTVEVSNYQLTGKPLQRVGNASARTCPYQPFECSDGMLIIAVVNDQQFRNLARAVGLSDLANDPRFATNSLRVEHSGVLLPMLTDATRKLTVERCRAMLSTAGIPCGPINTIAQTFEDEQVRHRGMWQEVVHPVKGTTPIVANPLRLSETPIRYEVAPPSIGEHTAMILGELLGLDQPRIIALAESGAIGLPEGIGTSR